MTELHKGIPTCMDPIRGLPRWVLWRFEERNGKRTKPPYQAANPKAHAKTNDPTTWATYDETAAAAKDSDCGIGLMLSPDDDHFPYVAFDLDDCRNPDTGGVMSWAQELIEEAASYTEITPSGMGFRIIGNGGSHAIHCKLERPDGGHVEVYSQATRFITITGDHVEGTPETFNDLDDLVLRHKNENEENKEDGDASPMPPKEPPSPVLRNLVELRIDKIGREIPIGQRSEKFHHAVGWLKDIGWSEDDIVAYMEEHPDGIAAKYKNRIRKEVKRCYDKCAANIQPSVDVPTDLPRLYSLDELEGRPPTMFLIEQMLPEKGVAIIAGPSGVMKSYLMIYLALMIAAGKNLDTNKIVKRTGVIFMINEGQGGFPQRIRAALTHHGMKMPDNFRIAEDTPDLMREVSLDPFIEAIESLEYEPGLIVIDTFSKATIGGDDNSTSDMALAISTAEKLARRFDALVVLIDHEGKDPKKGVRGAYSKYANAEMVGRVRKISNTVTLTTVKQKEAEDNLQFNFKVNLVEVTHPKTSSVREVPALSYWTDVDSLNQKDFILTVLTTAGAITRKKLADRFCDFYGKDKRKSFDQQYRRLLKAEKIRVEDGRVQSSE